MIEVFNFFEIARKLFSFPSYRLKKIVLVFFKGLKCDVSVVGERSFDVDGRSFTVCVVDPTDDYTALMKVYRFFILSINSITTLLGLIV